MNPKWSADSMPGAATGLSKSESLSKRQSLALTKEIKVGLARAEPEAGRLDQPEASAEEEAGFQC